MRVGMISYLSGDLEMVSSRGDSCLCNNGALEMAQGGTANGH